MACRRAAAALHSDRRGITVEAMTTPFFSVLLPTKNRAGVLPYAVRSLRDQSFRDFEVVLVDNDDTGATAAMWHEGLLPRLDARFRYRRTGGLWMAENWEAGLAGLRGEYVYVMEDKAVLHPRAFELLQRSIDFYAPRCLVFSAGQHGPPTPLSIDQVEAAPPFGFATLPEAPLPLRPISSTRILDEFLEHGWRTLHDDGPRGINSVCERSVIAQIQETSGGGRFFLPFAPDVTSALLQLDLLEGMGRMELQLVSFARSVELSLGWRFRTSLTSAAAVLAQGGAAAVAHVAAMPLGDLPVLHNLLYAEFLMVRQRARGWLRGKRLAAERYCARIADDLDELARGGEDVAAVRARLDETRQRLGNAGL
jgi:hypothetical protein